MKNLNGGNNCRVWAVFNCARNLQVDPKLLGLEKTRPSISENTVSIITHAVGLGELLTADRDFVEQMTSALQSFLH